MGWYVLSFYRINEEHMPLKSAFYSAIQQWICIQLQADSYATGM